LIGPKGKPPHVTAQADSADGAAALAVFGQASSAPKRTTRNGRRKNRRQQLRRENDELRAQLTAALAALERTGGKQ
jgi:hypothetical protein